MSHPNDPSKIVQTVFQPTRLKSATVVSFWWKHFGGLLYDFLLTSGKSSKPKLKKKLFPQPVCEEGHFDVSTKCEKSCSVHCKYTCDSITGECTEGCKPGYKGTLCNNKCKVGKFGAKCEKTCSPHCLNRSCNHIHGSCPSGCKHGYSGKLCDQKTGDLVKYVLLFLIFMFVAGVGATFAKRFEKVEEPEPEPEHEPEVVVVEEPKKEDTILSALLTPLSTVARISEVGESVIASTLFGESAGESDVRASNFGQRTTIRASTVVSGNEAKKSGASNASDDHKSMRESRVNRTSRV
ncbi:multiple epidermal growth factor-like domains 10 [Elysia marginata]|uniref:Multiple epidermal growth factor-like domains 10 n=1 Tax=Elysia marginata TaxID=1093978 RepID=A0AAV4H3C7_9GAST|nr:multiple epidermal growth factor-like domains 10 [Elysia marginata]